MICITSRQTQDGLHACRMLVSGKMVSILLSRSECIDVKNQLMNEMMHLACDFFTNVEETKETEETEETNESKETNGSESRETKETKETETKEKKDSPLSVTEGILLLCP